MYNDFKHLLQPLKVGSFVFKNRMTSSNSMPHFSQGPEKYPAAPTISHYYGRARTGAAWITLNGVDDNVGMPEAPDTVDFGHFPDFDMHDAKCQNYMTELIEAMHGIGTLVSGAIFSASRIYRYENPQGEIELVDTNARQISDYEGMFGLITDSTPADVFYKVAKSCAQRTLLYKRLGFDGVTVHMSYRSQLQGQMLSPISNKRTDEYGGSFENRVRFPLMLLKEIKEAAGNDMLIELQFSPEEPEGGYSFEEGMRFLKLAEPYIDIVQVRSSDVNLNHPIPFETEHMPFLELAAKVKAEGFNFLVSGTGGYFYPEELEKAIADGKLDLVAMARAWISNPDYGELLYENRAEDLVPCLRCNKCHGRAIGEVLSSTCSVNPKLGLEAVEDYLACPAGKKKKVAVIGGGPGGLRTAIFLADKGHEVTVYEQSSSLGGAIRHSDFVDFKWTLKDYKDYLIRQVGKRDIRVLLNSRAEAASIDGLYDCVVVAIGAEAFVPQLEGFKNENVYLASDVLTDHSLAKGKIVIIGGGEVGVETGILLAGKGMDVTVLARRNMLAHDAAEKHYYEMVKDKWESYPNFKFVLNADAKSIDEKGVNYEIKGSGLKFSEKADTVILACGMRAKRDEALSFYGCAPYVYYVGDCKKPGSIQTVNRMAYIVSKNI